MGKDDVTKGFVFKITVIGDGAVGKTSLIKKYTQGSFQKDYIKTLGAQFSKYDEEIGRDNCKLFFWDIAGQREFDFMRPTFYKGSKAAIIVFSHTDENSYIISRIGMKTLKNIREISRLFCLVTKLI